MAYEIIWDEDALHELDKLEHTVARRIVKKVKSMEDGLLSADVLRLKGSPDYRLRVGDYRVIFEVNRKQIVILKIGHRKNIHDRS